MSHEKYYCLRCRKPNMGCKCGKTDMRFYYSHKLRVPTSIENHARFRKFLDCCPSFVNMIQENQRNAFRDLLHEIRYFNKAVNGFEWTRVENKVEKDIKTAEIEIQNKVDDVWIELLNSDGKVNKWKVDTFLSLFHKKVKAYEDNR